MSAIITVPKLGEFLLGSAHTAHNRCAKAAVKGALATHLEERIPGHFERGAHEKYGYAARQAHYRAQKQKRYGSSADLVQTGASKQGIKATAKISSGGNASAGTTNGKLTISFSWVERVKEFHARRIRPGAMPPKQRKKPQVTIPMMKAELARITKAEAGEMTSEIGKTYVREVKSTTGGRQQVRG